MELTVLAATGGIGQHLLEQALAAGHRVTAVVRNPAKLGDRPGVKVVRADLGTAGAAELREAVEGADAVLSGLGAVGKAGVGVAEHGTRAVVEAMRQTGARRLVVVSAAPVGTVPSPARPNPPRHDPGEGAVMRYVLTPMVKRVLRAHYADLARMEDVVLASGLDWTVVRPPRLTDKPLTRDYRVAYGQNLRGGSTVSRADVAHCMLRSVTDPDTAGRILGVAD
ncbi:NAD(P)-dependent oxidoreductase [Streptomyces sp. TLI_171]|uniref:NAD(P)-dependent oxidoreductase n=1 Tax=Streptomyces sp. TLI_171 TaxID=1938859 RepID=UPI000C174FBC|nr:NAD(P)-binding oxidoreductase [Streptomyces sp. TLI_171]RKE20090.1 putative NADH-flavin reductase [Streptomyces sp. TLI_171]